MRVVEVLQGGCTRHGARSLAPAELGIPAQQVGSRASQDPANRPHQGRELVHASTAAQGNQIDEQLGTHNALAGQVPAISA